MAGVRVHVLFSPELLARIDEAAALAHVSRGELVRRLAESGLSPAGFSGAAEQALGLVVMGDPAAPALAEQSESSFQSLLTRGLENRAALDREIRRNKEAVEQALGDKQVGSSLGQAPGETGVKEVESLPAPAEQPEAAQQALEGRPGASVSPGVQLPAPAPAEQPATLKEFDAALAGAAEAMSPWSYRQHVPGPNVEPVRSSFQAKRDVAPVPKAEVPRKR